MECNLNNSIYIAPWLSWHEYILSGYINTLIFEQHSHSYYLLSDEAAEAWRELCAGRVIANLLHHLQPLINDGVISFNYEIENKLISTDEMHHIKTTKHQTIPDYFNKELRKEGYIFDAHWDITNKCNAKCIHCYNPNAHSGLRNKDIDELSFEEAKKLVDELIYLGVFRLVLSGGEVLTKSYFLPLCKYIRKHNIQLIIYTNGIAFTEEMQCNLASLHPSTICFSVYGDNDCSHDNITRVKGSYQKTLNALSYFSNHHIDTCHKNTILSENFTCWKETLKKGNTLASKSLLNCTIYPSLDNRRLSEYCVNESQLVELAMSPDSPIYYKRRIVGACNIHKSNDYTPCYNETNTIYITPKGEICLCIAFPFVIASLRDGNIRTLKRNRRNKKFINELSMLKGTDLLDNWRSLKISNLKECGTYDYCEYCIDVCPGDAYMLTGDLLKAPENHCLIAKARHKAFLLNNTEQK